MNSITGVSVGHPTDTRRLTGRAVVLPPVAAVQAADGLPGLSASRDVLGEGA